MSNAGRPHVLIVDSELPVRRLLRRHLVAQGYHVSEAGNGTMALHVIRSGSPDIVVLDPDLPDTIGFDIIAKLRGSSSAVQIITLSSRGDLVSKITALNLGADDYVEKPFGVDEFLARVRVSLRHRLQQQGTPPNFRSGNLAVDLVRRIVTVGDREVKLSSREYQLLRLLIAHAGKALSYKFLLRGVLASDRDVRFLRVYIHALRQKIEINPERPQHIITEQGFGYRLRSFD